MSKGAVGLGWVLLVGCSSSSPDHFEAILSAAADPKGKPLLVALHGRKGTAEGLLETTDLDGATGDHASLLAIQARPIFNGTTGWDLEDPAEIERLWATVDEALSTTGADPEHIILAGYSLGGMMVMRTVCDAPDRVASMALVAGAMEKSLVDSCPDAAIPGLFFHGRADTQAPWNGTRSTLSVPDMVDFWVQANDCDPLAESADVPDVVPWDDSTATIQTWSGCLAGSVVLFDLADSGHAWPGATNVQAPSTGINMDVNASTEIVERLIHP